MMKENQIKIYNYVKEHENENITAADIAEALFPGEDKKRSVDGIVTASFQRHKEVVGENKVDAPLMKRVPGAITLEDGSHKPVKFIKLTDKGRAFDPTV